MNSQRFTFTMRIVKSIHKNVDIAFSDLISRVKSEDSIISKTSATFNWSYYKIWEAWNRIKVRYIISNKQKKKRAAALSFWLRKKAAEGELSHSYFTHLYTDHLGISREELVGKRLLDIGCGPRGSLEWATMAAERIGVDPLIEEYYSLGISDHKMTYINRRAEDLPFADASFDIVYSGNSLDHVEDLAGAISEIKRVTRPGGVFALITEVRTKETTVTEPQSFSWDIVEEFEPEFKLEWMEKRQKTENGVYQSATEGPNISEGYSGHGVLSARFIKVNDSS